jgi:hypothetical protein
MAAGCRAVVNETLRVAGWVGCDAGQPGGNSVEAVVCGGGASGAVLLVRVRPVAPLKSGGAGGAARGGRGLGQGALAVKPEETFWQRLNFGRESWWDSFWGAIRAAWRDR